MVLPLDAERVVIGRRSDADIVLGHYQTSRQHAQVSREADSWVLTDLKSTHGTFVNSTRIERHVLQAGDQIRLGREGVQLLYLEGEVAETHSSSLLQSEELEVSVRRLASVVPEESGAHSDLEKISCLLDFHYSFGKAFSAERTFHHILQSALKISGAERGFVTRNQDGRQTYVLGLDGSGRVLREADFRTSRSAVEQVTRTGEPVFMTQGIHGELAAQVSIVAMKLRAIACLPLEAMSQEGDAATVMGIVYLDSQAYMHSLSGLDEKLLRRLAGEAGHVLEKLALVETLAERQRMEQELAVAEEIQRTLLPRVLPDIPPYRIRAFSRATRYLGGDFYDFIPTRNNELTGVLADVSGKGIPAALLSSFTIGALNMEFRNSDQPDVVLSGVNKLLCEKTPASRFVTLFLFQLDPNGSGRYISAGHNTAFVFRASSGELEDLASGGMPLGMFPLATCQSLPLRLAPGDTLVIYSDGLTDAENRAGEEFGDKRLCELIRSSASNGVEALESCLHAALDSFTQGVAQTDDITFLLVENTQL
jgi:serine phosphatase RsbU (regulator of sigma subunit)/pSer/pThr/pTyr-binding forkhead associated (FHA) protein